MKVKFDNGWGASIIDNGYGAKDGLLEVGVIHPDGRLCYGAIDSYGGDCVVGWLNGDALRDVLDKIADLPNDPGFLTWVRQKSDGFEK